jgi:hypothetical protein
MLTTSPKAQRWDSMPCANHNVEGPNAFTYLHTGPLRKLPHAKYVDLPPSPAIATGPHSHQCPNHNAKGLNAFTHTQALTKASPCQLSVVTETPYRDEGIGLAGFEGGGRILRPHSHHCANHTVNGFCASTYTHAPARASPCELIGSTTDTRYRDERKGVAGFQDGRRI